jgi:phage virion morphogenesis protein
MDVKVILVDGEVRAALTRLELASRNMGDAMKAIAASLADEVEENFEQQGRPRWQALKNPSEKRQGGRILQDSGQLAASISTRSNRNMAMVGTNKVYGAIHQFGGQAGRGRKVTLVARPFLPVTASSELQAEAKTEVLATILRHLQNAANF